MTPPTADRRRTTDIGRKRKSMTSDTTTRRPGGAVTTAALALALASIPLTTSGRADAVAARAAPTLAGAYVGGVHLGLGGTTQVWPVFEPSLRHGVVGGTYGSVATDSRRPGWLGRQSRAALRVRGSLAGTRLTFDVVYRGAPWYRFSGAVRAHTIVGTMHSLTAHDAAAYPLTFYDCTATLRAITPCAIGYAR